MVSPGQDSFLELAGKLPEEADEEPDRQWHRERQVREHEASVGVDQSQLAKQQVERRHDRDLGKHRDRQNGGQHQGSAWKWQPGQCVRTQCTDGHAQESGGPGHDERVPYRRAEGVLAEHGAIVVEHEPRRHEIDLTKQLRFRGE